jgi:thiosulfate dehydrogenase [quinone] large subunit
MWQVRGPDGAVATGWYLLPLRLFLGVTFVYAGLQKLANPDFFKASSPISIHSQLLGASRTSPIGGMLTHLVGSASGIGALIAVAEVAIGVGALLGLLTRVAAVGGMLVSLSLFLAISFHSRPYFTGSDIVFFFAWTPLVLGGAAGAPALDTWLAGRRAAGTTAAGTAEAAPEGALTRGAVVGLVAAASAVLIGVVAGVGRALAPASTNAGNTLRPVSTTTTSSTASSLPSAGGGATTTTTAPLPKGTSIGAASQVPVGGSAAFNDPSTGDPSLVIQQTADDFKAFDAICPHAGCTVAYQASAKIIACPCHGSEFNPTNGEVIQGPATSGLNPIKVVKGSNGDLYVI